MNDLQDASRIGARNAIALALNNNQKLTSAWLSKMKKELIERETQGLLDFIEEPLLSENPEGLAQIAQLTSTPIALGERLYSRWDFKPIFERAIADIIQPDLSHAGGISETRRIAAMAAAT